MNFKLTFCLIATLVLAGNGGRYRIRKKFNRKLYNRVNLLNQPYLRGPSSPETRVPPPISLSVGLNSGGAPGSRQQVEEPAGIQQTVKRTRPFYKAKFGDGSAPKEQDVAGIEQTATSTPPDSRIKEEKPKLPKKKIEREKIAYVCFSLIKK